LLTLAVLKERRAHVMDVIVIYLPIPTGR